MSLSCLTNTISGVISELAAISKHDTALYMNPESTLWTQSYARVTNFAIAEHNVGFVDNPKKTWDSTMLRAELPRSGDLLSEVYFAATLTALPVPDDTASVTDVNIWTPAVGLALLDKSILQVGDSRLETVDSHYAMMIDEIHRAEGKRLGMQVGDYGNYLRSWRSTNSVDYLGFDGDQVNFEKALHFSTRDQEIYAKIPFHFSETPEAVLNMVGLQYHKVQVMFELRARKDLIISGQLSRGDGAFSAAAPTYTDSEGNLKDARVVGVYVHLDEHERRIRAQQPGEVMIVQTQSAEIPVASTDNVSGKEYRCHFNNPVVDLMWAYLPDDAVPDVQYKKEYFRYGGYSAQKIGFNNNYAPQEVIDVIKRVQMSVNGNPRFDSDATYLREAIPQMRSARKPSRLVYQYSFARDPSQKGAPSGSFNFSQIDNLLFKFYFREMGNDSREKIAMLTSAVDSNFLLAASLKGTIFLYARTINFYKQAGGMLGITYAVE